MTRLESLAEPNNASYFFTCMICGDMHQQLGIWTLPPVASVYRHENTESDGPVTTSADTLTQNQMDHRDKYTNIFMSADTISITSSIIKR